MTTVKCRYNFSLNISFYLTVIGYLICDIIAALYNIDQNATECLASFVSVGRQELLAWGSDSGFTMRSLLDAASRLVILVLNLYSLPNMHIHSRFFYLELYPSTQSRFSYYALSTALGIKLGS